MADSLKQQVASLPAAPGVYVFRDARGDVLYVGKAKVLRVRVRSYFRERADLDPAKADMVGKIAKIETIVTTSENEALILEANLIREHKPPYNVVLTDDKYYLFIKVTREELPRVFPVRRLRRDGGRYFGPYSSASSVRRTLKLLKRLFPHRSDVNPASEWVFPHPLFSLREKSAPRLPADLSSVVLAKDEALAKAGSSKSEVGRRRTPQDETSNPEEIERYKENIKHIVRFLKGDRDEIMETLRRGMKTAAKDQQYERAAIFRNQLDALERLEGHQKVHLARGESFDVISVAQEGGRSAANVFRVRRGKLLGKNTFLLKHRSGAVRADVVRQFLLQYYRDVQAAGEEVLPRAIFVPEALADDGALARWLDPEHPPAISRPRRGVKRQLLAMGELNAQQLLQEQRVQFADEARLGSALAELAAALGMSGTTLSRIETYDISNIQGTLPTGSMVVFADGKPDKAQYRKFKIQLGETPNDYVTPRRPASRQSFAGQVLQEGKPNDYAMLQQVLRRRFSGKHEDWRVPDLILIDGGKGQLSRAKQVLDELGVAAAVAAIAKREEILYILARPNLTTTSPPTPLLEKERGAYKEIRLPYDSDALYLVQRMRDEAHRFTLSYHRLLRSKRHSRSLLDEIPGIGPTTKKKLLNHFGSLKAIRAASEDELRSVIGSKAALVREYL